ncbi:hypothetical protein MXB_535, partial [Myxobolus squamalis]
FHAENDVRIPKKENPFLHKLHVKFLESFHCDKNDKFADFNYIRLNAICWNITSLFLLKRENIIDRGKVVEFVQSCLNDDGGYGAYPEYGSNIHSTLCAIQ